MTLRPADLSDHPALLALWLQSVRATHHFLSESDIEDLIPVVRDQALTQLEVWVLCGDAREPVGFMGLDDNKLEALFIAPSHFGRGGGKRLLAHARALKGPLTVDVNEQNPGATAFYLAQGFKPFGRSATDAAGRPFPLLHLCEP
ncbi:GNAT family N-acetyltransferase [Pelomonas sp. CA6]|uniref:GNAT family N-acetyltransferase n=1 Tax=Pelomonas sp. CA6 TaxID=2907999 RepID=UPI001F4ACDB4|nr:GNAT family N-acetyltransferase [Pelomonas sp. CA6]MCH7342573.1 GNAT family N-acetyltransferase [Pelomonas sp. CA6]